MISKIRAKNRKQKMTSAKNVSKKSVYHIEAKKRVANYTTKNCRQ